TGWFDTGKQGKEWPGDFEIVPKGKPYSGRAAKSVLDKDAGKPLLRVGLRGVRPLVGRVTHLHFRYHLSGAKEVAVVLRRMGGGGDRSWQGVMVKALAQGKWAEMTVDLSDAARIVSEPHEVVFWVLREGDELLIDDILLYEPASAKGD